MPKPNPAEDKVIRDMLRKEEMDRQAAQMREFGSFDDVPLPDSFGSDASATTMPSASGEDSGLGFDIPKDRQPPPLFGPDGQGGPGASLGGGSTSESMTDLLTEVKELKAAVLAIPEMLASRLING